MTDTAGAPCSVLWDRADASAYGTAAEAAFWVALEQPGPWGREAAVQSHLDRDLGEALSVACQEHGGRFVLIRRPGAHADAHDGSAPTVLVAGGLRAGVPWLLSGTLDDPADLGRLPLAALGEGEPEAAWDRMPELDEAPPALLVCANSKRDVCCAVRGRPVALAAGAAAPGRVWECSHTGGHRFAPTGVLLPFGQTLARLDAPLALAALEAAGGAALPAALLGPAHDRGRSVLTPAAQAAESQVRADTGETSLVALSTTAHPTADGWSATVRHTDGRAWHVHLTREEGEPRPESCGKAAVPTYTWRADVRDA